MTQRGKEVLKLEIRDQLNQVTGISTLILPFLPFFLPPSCFYLLWWGVKIVLCKISSSQEWQHMTLILALERMMQEDRGQSQPALYSEICARTCPPPKYTSRKLIKLLVPGSCCRSKLNLSELGNMLLKYSTFFHIVLALGIGMF